MALGGFLCAGDGLSLALPKPQRGIPRGNKPRPFPGCGSMGVKPWRLDPPSFPLNLWLKERAAGRDGRKGEGSPIPEAFQGAQSGGRNPKQVNLPLAAVLLWVPQSLRQSPGRVPIDVMETLKLLGMIHGSPVLLSLFFPPPHEEKWVFNPDKLSFAAGGGTGTRTRTHGFLLYRDNYFFPSEMKPGAKGMSGKSRMRLQAPISSFKLPSLPSLSHLLLPFPFSFHLGIPPLLSIS